MQITAKLKAYWPACYFINKGNWVIQVDSTAYPLAYLLFYPTIVIIIWIHFCHLMCTQIYIGIYL